MFNCYSPINFVVSQLVPFNDKFANCDEKGIIILY